MLYSRCKGVLTQALLPRVELEFVFLFIKNRFSGVDSVESRAQLCLPMWACYGREVEPYKILNADGCTVRMKVFLAHLQIS